MNEPTTFQLADDIVRCLKAVREMLWRYVLAQGLLLVALWLLLVFWLGGLLDYLPVTMGSKETPRWVRIGLLLAMGLGSLWILWWRVISRTLTGLKDESLALLIERRYPEMNNELVTTVELSRRAETDISNPLAHQAMLQRVHASAAQRMSRVHVVELFEWQPLWALGVATVLGLVITLIAAVGLSDWMNLWTMRLLALSDQPWPRQAALRADGIQLQVPSFSTQLSAQRISLPFVDNVVRAPRGAAVMLQISADASARLPEVCTLFYHTEDGVRGRANLRRVGSPRGGWQQFTLDGPPLDGLAENIYLDVVGLDARLRGLKIEVVEPAVIAAMQLQCAYPSYLQDELSARPPQELINYRSGVSIPEGTQITLSGRASSQLSSVEYVLYSSSLTGSEDPNEPAASNFQILNTVPNGDQFSIPLGTLHANQVVEVRLLDEFGLSTDQIPRYVISMQADTVPEVNTRLEGIGLAITPAAQLPIRGTVTDDHGIAQVMAELAVNEAEPILIPLELNEGALRSTIDLEKLPQSQRPQPGATLGMVVTARDFYDLSEIRHTGRGQPVQLAVVTQDQLLVMLDRQELELRQRLEQIVSELEQLRDVLHTLRSELTPAANATLQTTRKSTVYAAVFNAQGGKDESRAEQVRRLSSLWAQQSVLQADKSQQELSSVASRVDNLCLQLVNNRIDSYDRQERLRTKVHDPLRKLLAKEYDQLRRSLSELQTATLSGGGTAQAGRSASALDVVLLQLEAIKSNMQDIEDFNEIIDLVRGLLEDQERVLTQTEEEQRKRILDLLR